MFAASTLNGYDFVLVAAVAALVALAVAALLARR